jgi:hypothetical protein
MRRSYTLPKDVLAVLIGRVATNECYPHIDFAVCDAHLTTEMSPDRFEIVESWGVPLRLECYIPTHKCTVLLREGYVAATEGALKALERQEAVVREVGGYEFIAVGPGAVDMSPEQEVYATRFLFSCLVQYGGYGTE